MWSLAAEAQNHEAAKGKPGIAWRKAVNAVAIRTLLLQEARARELQSDPAEVGSGRFETDEEALIRGLLEDVVAVETPGEDDVRREWEHDPSRFRSPLLWEVSHILRACDPRDDEVKTAAYAHTADRWQWLRQAEATLSLNAGLGVEGSVPDGQAKMGSV